MQYAGFGVDDVTLDRNNAVNCNHPCVAICSKAFVGYVSRLSFNPYTPYRVIDREWLLRLLAVPGMSEFRQWYCRTLEELCQREGPYPREPFWSTSLAVGSRPWIEGLVGDDSEAQRGIMPLDSGAGTCRLNATEATYHRLMKKWQKEA